MDDTLHLLLRFAHYGVLMGLFGLAAFRAFGLRQVTMPDEPAPMFGWVEGSAIAAPIVTGAVFLTSVAAMVGQSVWTVEWSIVEAMVQTTDMGWAFAMRFAVLLLAIAPVMLRVRWQRGHAVAALLYAGALLTLPWSGHAAAQIGTLGMVHRLNDAIHLLAAAYWIGAVGWFAVLAVSGYRGTAMLPPEQLLNFMHRFRRIGLALVAVVALTGALNAHLIFGIGNSGAVLGTPYGQLLAAKIVLVAVMLAFASRHAGLAEHQDVADGQVLTRVRRSLAGELATAIVIIGAVAAIGMLSPMPEPSQADIATAKGG